MKTPSTHPGRAARRLCRCGLAVLGLFLVWGMRPVALKPQPPARPTGEPCSPVGQIVTTAVASPTFGQPVPVSVYLPPCYERLAGPLPVIYLLHGAISDQTQWPDLLIQPEADRLIASGQAPFVVVMPGGTYFDQADYGTFVLSDLLPAIERQYRVQAQGAGRAVGGVSLGGYWALKIAFQHPDQFAAVGGNSPVVGSDSGNDPLGLARSSQGLDRLRIRLDVGTQDDLRAGTAQLAEALRARDLNVDFVVSPGAHEAAYWRAHTGEYLSFYLSALAPRPRQCRRPATGCHRFRVRWTPLQTGAYRSSRLIAPRLKVGSQLPSQAVKDGWQPTVHSLTA